VATAIVAVVSGALLGAVVVAQARFGIPYSHLLADPSAWAPVPAYAGAVSYLMIVIWAATAAISLFAVALPLHPPMVRRAFLLRAGLISAGFGLDDLFALHERVLPNLLRVPEVVVLVVYGLILLTHLAISRTAIRASQWPLLAVALGLFAISVGVDVASGSVVPDRAPVRVLEDGAKLAGLLFWLLYHVDVAASVAGHASSSGRTSA
jgi:hypothetical protein